MADSPVPILPQTRVLPLTSIRRDRRLAAPGHVMVAVGDRVDAVDVIARSSGEPRLHPVPLGRYMQAQEAALDKYLLKHPGDMVEPREIIASKPQLFGSLQRIYRAPGAGRISAVQGTWLTLELTDAPFELRALYRGTVINLLPSYGVTLEAIGSLVQGVWGDGGEGYGVLKKIVETSDALVTDDKVNETFSGSIVLGGAGITEQAFRKAAQLQVAGLILGGIQPSLRDLVRTLKLPTVVTEGFGEHAMAGPIFELLASHVGEAASLDAAPRQDRAWRTEVFIPALSERELAKPFAPLTAQMNARVRLLTAPSEGAIGKIVKIPPVPQSLESGVTAWGADVELTGSERVFAPWQNLELID